MKVPALLIAAASIGGGCTGGSQAQPPSTRATVPASTQTVLKEVELRHAVYLARIEVHTTITPDGRLRQVRIDNKSWGPNDLDPKYERRVIREGRLTPQQMRDMAASFVGWESLAGRYSGVPDGGEISLRYGDKTVSGGSATPKQVWDIQKRIDDVAMKMPVLEK
jgi:hypothetical protein